MSFEPAERVAGSAATSAEAAASTVEPIESAEFAASVGTAAPAVPVAAAPASAGIATILQYLGAVPAWYLATSVDGQPHVRPFSFAAEQGGKVWFVTATTKDVWQELLVNQRFEATSWWPGHGWLILRGEAGLTDEANPEMRRAGYEHLEKLGESYDGPDDPTLVFFSVEHPQAWICNHDEWVPVEL